ncbi:hypothetical protein BSK66_25015 [Paenibacillus odorifer]|uniref:hypothetical protein n=1 Tax=Paenibacillus sp. FSL K6-2524 TaxID=2954516 RepID=UPI0003E1DA8A|nr:hypothetical protein C171_20374 [Paenibacillus sp. FSL H8-237]OME50725.1 hypothetical protein BSK66_25015 [Paenibacillus odorifer]
MRVGILKKRRMLNIDRHLTGSHTFLKIGKKEDYISNYNDQRKRRESFVSLPAAMAQVLQGRMRGRSVVAMS